MTILVNKSGKKLSAQFLETFCKDVGFLEQFITVLGDSRIDYQFTELKQTIKFLLSDNYQNYIVSHVREGDFAAVNPTNLTVLLEKAIVHCWTLRGSETEGENYRCSTQIHSRTENCRADSHF
ncbi:hypothetical protein BC830DRAFT_738025 [Chytriomyces sp. MP71]|nr:hypothetical protein BC830DRAFT_738025 [Chytriomyces sp. MP71]